MGISKEINIAERIRNIPFSSEKDCVVANRYGNGVALAYINRDHSAMFPDGNEGVGDLLRNEYDHMNFFDVFFRMKDGIFTGDIYGDIGAIPGLKQREHKEGLLSALEDIAISLPRRSFGLGELKPVCFVNPHEDFDFLLMSKGYVKKGNRRWKELSLD